MIYLHKDSKLFWVYSPTDLQKHKRLALLHEESVKWNCVRIINKTYKRGFYMGGVFDEGTRPHADLNAQFKSINNC